MTKLFALLAVLGAAPAPPSPVLFTDADAAPLFAAGPLAKARADYQAERWPEAASGFAKAKAPEARYLRGLALAQARSFPEALTALDGLEVALPDLADRVAFWRARAHEGAGDGKAAARAYGAVKEGSLLWADSQLARARALHAAGDRAGALDALAPILTLPSPDEVTNGDPASEGLLLTGRLRASGGKGQDLPWARRAFLECWAGHPLSAVAASCLAELKKLPKPYGAPPSGEEALRRAEGLLDANHIAPALAELLKLVPQLPAPGPGEDLACSARYALGKAYRKDRQHGKAIETLTPVVERCGDAGLRVRAVYVLASSSSIVAPEDGVRWYRLLARDYPAPPFADDALFFAADLLARAGHTDEALAALADLSEKYPKGDFRPEALFRWAWIEKQEGNTAGALAALSRIERDYEASDPYEHARASYWTARFLVERGGEGDLARAHEAWRVLAEKVPADYYGLLARARLEEAKAGSAPPWPHPVVAIEPDGLRLDPGALRSDRHFRAGVLLLRMGLERAAAEELAAVERKALAGDGLLLVAELLDRAGDHKASQRLVRALGRAALRRRPEGAGLRIWRVAYPAAFRDEVQRYAPAAGVPPDLLLALMREESGLDPKVISGAGAVGLTQLMLPTAQEVARKLKMGRVRQQDLMRPAVSVRLGATYFGGLLRRYGGSEALALAAYNAGGSPVARWLEKRRSLPLDAFVEEIPMQETRGYVKRVLRSYAVYRFLYGDGSDKAVLLGQALPAAP